jgi:hypothetical protein
MEEKMADFDLNYSVVCTYLGRKNDHNIGTYVRKTTILEPKLAKIAISWRA